MNWLDLGLIVSPGIGALVGAWMGTIREAFALGVDIALLDTH